MTPYIVAVLVLAIVGIIFLLRGRSSQPEVVEETYVDEYYPEYDYDGVVTFDNEAQAEEFATASEDLEEAEEDTSQSVDESYTKRQLYEIARSIGLKGRSKLDKGDLIDAINDELEDNQLTASKIFNRF